MTADKNKQNHMRDMTEGDSLKMIIRFAIPLVAASVIQQLFSLTDAMVLGIYGGNRGLAVLGVCSWPVWFQVSVLTNLGQAACLLTAVRFGAKDEESLKKAIGNVYFVSILMGIIMIPGLQAAVRGLLQMQNTPSEVLEDAVLYLRIIYVGTVFLLIYNTLSSLLRALGDSYTSFQAITVSAVVNVVMDVILVAGFDMGVKGAAIATTASQVLSAVICLVKISRYPVFSIPGKYLKPDLLLLKEYAGICIPMMAQSIVIAVGGIFVQFHINRYGTAFAAGVSAAGKIFSVVETGAIALASASASFVSQNVGARRFDRIRRAVWQVCGLSELAAAAIAAVLLLTGEYILSFYVRDEAIFYAMGNLRVYSMGLLIMYPMYSLRQIVQALGNLKIPLLAALLQLVMRVLTANYLPLLIGRSGIYYTSFAAWLVSLILIGAVCPVQYRKSKMESERRGRV